MKIILVSFLSLLFVLTSCQETVEKPKNLIDEDKMIDILYDFALIEGIKSDNALGQESLDTETFIYKKYKIDSVQLVKSNQFYASDIDNYEKMYKKVSERIESKKNQLEAAVNKNKVSKKTEGNELPTVK